MPALSEAEEFEFRRRAEAEHAAPKDRSFMDGVGDFMQRNGRGLATTGGAVLGGILASPAAIASAPSVVGPVAIEAGGIGGGAAIGGQLYDRITGRNQRMAEQLKTVGGDVLQNAPYAMAGPLAGKALQSAPRIGQLLAKMPAKAASVLDAGATPAANAMRSSAMAKVLATRQTLSDAEALAASKKAADVPLRATMEAAAGAQAAKGIGVSDIPEAKNLVNELKYRLKPGGPVVTIPTADQAKAYGSIIDALSPTAQGQKPSLEMVSNLRRQLAETAYGGADPSGYAAIGKVDRRDLVKKLHDIEDAYTGGASAPVRENWKAAMTASEKADELAKMKDTLTAQVAQLDELAPKAAATQAKSIVTSLAKSGLVPEDEFREFLRLANAATDAQGKAAFRKRLALYGAGVSGASAVGSGLVGHAAGVLP